MPTADELVVLDLVMLNRETAELGVITFVDWIIKPGRFEYSYDNWEYLSDL